MSNEIISVDLFCGAGGFSEGLRQACSELGYSLKHAGINHDEAAIATHEQNHPDADQYHSKVEQLHPPNVIQELVDESIDDVHTADVDVDLLLAGPECTHFSSARGGKPVSEQKRMSPWQVLDWLEKLDVEAFIIENVGEIQDWGPVEDGQPTKDGSIFEAWINALNQLGYSVNWTELVAADYGDPTTRKRFFLIGRQSGEATFPDATHAKNPSPDADRDPWRTAAEIIDWSDWGSSIWTRDLTQNLVHSPPKNSTMERIAEGIRRHCDDRLEPFADVLDQIGNGNEEEPTPMTVQGLRDRVVPYEYADVVAGAVEDPFLVALPPQDTPSDPYVIKQKNNSPCQPVTDPIDTIHANGNHYWLGSAESVILRQQDGAHPTDVTGRPVPTIPTRGAHAIATLAARSLIKPKNGSQRGLHSNPLYPPENQPHHTVTADPRSKLVTPSLIRYSHGGRSLSVDEPMPTIATERGGVFALSDPYLAPLYNPRPGQRPRTRAVDRPLMTIPASKSPAAVTSPVVTPFIDDYEGPPKSLDEPLGTITSRDKFALCVPELWPWGLDVRYRMLQPRELKQAQGFPEGYEISGTKEQRTSQIGNAVPVTLAKKLCKHLLTAEDPSLASYGGGISPDPDAEIPSYEEVLATDD